MGAQNILTYTTPEVDELVNSVYVCMGDKWMVKKRFNVGKYPDLELFEQVKWLNRILQNNDCHQSCNAATIKEKINTLTNLYQ